jgi:hypothetical protein
MSTLFGNRHSTPIGHILDEEGNKTNLDFVFSEKLLRTHLLFQGVSGTGKTQTLKHLCHWHILRNYSFLLVDPVGTLCSGVVRFLASINTKLYLAERRSPTGLAQLIRRKRISFATQRFIFADLTDPDIGGVRFNPIQNADDLTTAQTVGVFLRCLQRLVGSLDEMRRLQLVLRSVLTMLIELGPTTLHDVPAFLCCDTETLEEYTNRLQRKWKTGELRRAVPSMAMIATYMREFFIQTKSRERRELVQSAFNAINLLLSDERFATLVSSPKSNISFSRAVNEGQTILLNVPAGIDLNTQSVVGALFVSRVQLVAERRAWDVEKIERGEYPPYGLIVDEFQTFMGPEWTEAIARVRNLNLNVTAAFQSCSQPPFHTLEGRALLEAFRANCSCHVYFRISPTDATDVAGAVFQPRGHMLKREYEEVSHGDTWSTSTSTSASTTKSHSKGQSEGTSESTSEGTNVSFSSSWTVADSETSANSIATSEGESHSNSSSSSSGESSGSGHSDGFSYGHGMSDMYAMEFSPIPGIPTNHGVSQFGSNTGGNSTNYGTNSSHGTSQSESQSTSKSRGKTISKGQSKTNGNSQSHGNSHSKTSGVNASTTATEGSAIGNTKGRSEQSGGTRSVTLKREYYSVEEEKTILGYQLANQRKRECVVWLPGEEGGHFRIRTVDVPQSFVTKLGSKDLQSDFLKLARPKHTSMVSQTSLIERLCDNHEGTAKKGVA